MQRLHVGDQVVVIAGNDKGKRGKVTRIIKDQNKVIVEGVKIVKRHLKATPQRPGGILEVEAPIAASNVMPIDPTTGKPTRVKIKIENGVKSRVAKSGAVLASNREK
jgi:large subunit ribosomal protein L24